MLLPTPKERILLLEPTESRRESLAQQVHALGFGVALAIDVEEVLSLLTRARHPVVLVGPSVEHNAVASVRRRVELIQPDIVVVSSEGIINPKPMNSDWELLQDLLQRAVRKHAQLAAERFVEYVTRQPTDEVFRVLVADRDGAARSMLLALIGAHDPHDVMECASLEAALELSGAWDPDVVLIGLAGHREQALSAAVMLHRHRQDVPIVFVDDAHDPDFALKAIQVGVQDVLVRSRITQENLIHTLRAAVERRLARERMRYLEHYHPLTGLPNQRALAHQITNAIGARGPNDNQVALLLLNLDRFNALNVSLGADGGDRVLQSVAERLRALMLETEVLGHLGGDEFGIIVQHIDGNGWLQHRAQEFVDSMQQPIRVGGRDYLVTASVGIATYPESQTIDGLFEQASRAMRRAKRAGRNQIASFNQVQPVWSPEQVALEGDLAAALREQQFDLFYQPKLDAQTGVVTGVEALLRWRHPDRGVVFPGKFIPLLEETGLIVQVGRWALQTACMQAQQWHLAGQPLSVAINVSARQFHNGDLVAHVREALELSRLDPSYLELELTESLLLAEDEHIVDVLLEIRRMGIKLALDDFGTGYSSLAYLKKYPMDILKIDRSFIRDIPEDEQNIEIVKAIVSLAHTLGLRVTAEGIETEAQLDVVRSASCDRYQGYLASKPIPVDEFDAWIVGRDKAAA